MHAWTRQRRLRHAWLLRTHAENRFDESRKPQIRRMLGSNNPTAVQEGIKAAPPGCCRGGKIHGKISFWTTRQNSQQNMAETGESVAEPDMGDSAAETGATEAAVVIDPAEAAVGADLAEAVAETAEGGDPIAATQHEDMGGVEAQPGLEPEPEGAGSVGGGSAAGDPAASTGRTRELLSNTRSFRRRIGERRINAPIRVVRAFVSALFDSITGPAGTWGGTGVVGITSEDLVAYVNKIRYRLTEPIPDDVAAQMFAEADLARDGLLDVDELTNTAASCGVESIYLPRWCALFNLRVDPHSSALAMPLHVTKRHPIQSNSETTDDAVMFRPDMSATRAYKKPGVTSRVINGPVPGQRRCDGRRNVTEQVVADQLNATLSTGSDPDQGVSATIGFDALDQFNDSVRKAKAASDETDGGIAQPQMKAGYAPMPRPWLSAAIGELAWPAVPGSDSATSMTVREQTTHRTRSSGQEFNTNFHLDSNQDMRTAYAREFLQEQGEYNPPSTYQFRQEADPFSHGHATNFQRFIGNREPCVRPFESQRTGPYLPPSNHSFRPVSNQLTEPLRLVFAPTPKEKDIDGQDPARLALDQIDPYLAHRAYSSKLTLSKMPRQMVPVERQSGPLL
eukprot:COSAG05_NODE_381_length_10519_cov_17.942131_3_plen_623_part_00